MTKIVDLGCGFGLTTAAFTELFPNATVYGTNIPNTVQTRIANKLAAMYGFTVHSDAQEIGAPVDLVFASEYFEHFLEPISHLRHVIKNLSPRIIITANAFTADAIGHFDYYCIDGLQQDGKATSKTFANEMRKHGYAKIITKLWNNRPAYWRREETNDYKN